jgi:hypothetical protein
MRYKRLRSIFSAFGKQNRKQNRNHKKYHSTMGDAYVVALDVGTTNVRALLFDKQAGLSQKQEKKEKRQIKKTT